MDVQVLQKRSWTLGSRTTPLKLNWVHRGGHNTTVLLKSSRTPLSSSSKSDVLTTWPQHPILSQPMYLDRSQPGPVSKQSKFQCRLLHCFWCQIICFILRDTLKKQNIWTHTMNNRRMQKRKRKKRVVVFFQIGQLESRNLYLKTTVRNWKEKKKLEEKK